MNIERTFLGTFADDILTRCPRCSACAHLRRLAIDSDYRLTCTACGLVRDWVLRRDRVVPVPSAGPRLDGFGLELWLKLPCCGETLWAYNEQHVQFLQGLVSAKLRERQKDPQWGWSNGSLDSRLPKWILSAKNRRRVLAGVARLQQMAASAGSSSGLLDRAPTPSASASATPCRR